MRIATLLILASLASAPAARADVPAATVDVADDGHGTPREVVPVPAVPDSIAVPAPAVGDEVEKSPSEVPVQADAAAPKGTPKVPDSERHESAKDQ